VSRVGRASPETLDRGEEVGACSVSEHSQWQGGVVVTVGLCGDGGGRVVRRQQGGAAAGDRYGREAGKVRCGGTGPGSGRMRG
jgi:hypothetical protein